jgi:hypothetical protein
MKKANSQECSFFGRKLSNIDIGRSEGWDISIGCDDQRVMITLDCYGDGLDIDLEDLLAFAAKHCRGIVERVLKESEL